MKGRWISMVVLAGSLAVTAMAESGYQVTDHVKIGGSGGWDYVTADAAARRLYVSHSDRVEVLDLDSLKSVGVIENTPGVHGIALAPGAARIFISEGRADSVAMVDPLTFKIVAQIKTEKNPDAIIFDPATSRVFAFNGRSDSVTAIDVAAGSAVKTFAIGGRPEFAVADGNGHVFVDLEDKDQLCRIDSRGLKVEKTWPIPGCEEPSTLAFDSSHQRLFIGCGNQTLAVVDPSAGTVIARLPIGNHVDSTVFDAEKQLVFTSNGDGTMTVIHEESPNRYQVVQTVSTQRGARTVALDERTHRLFLPVSEYGPIAVSENGGRPRPTIIPGSFTVLVVGPAKS